MVSAKKNVLQTESVRSIDCYSTIRIAQPSFYLCFCRRATSDDFVAVVVIVVARVSSFAMNEVDKCVCVCGAHIVGSTCGKHVFVFLVFHCSYLHLLFSLNAARPTSVGICLCTYVHFTMKDETKQRNVQDTILQFSQFIKTTNKTWTILLLHRNDDNS